MGAKELPITDKRMTRFNVTQQTAVDMVICAIQNHLGGEIFIPKCPSYRITDVAMAIAPNLAQSEVGIRPSEKLHEQMISKDDAINTIDLGGSYAILPAIAFTDNRNKETYLTHYNAKSVPEDFAYGSDTNTEWETVDSLRDKIRRYVNSNFKVK